METLGFILGKKTTLSLMANCDIDYFVKLYRMYAVKLCFAELGNDDEKLKQAIKSNLSTGMMKIYTCITNHGKDYEKIGFIFTNDETEKTINMLGMIDPRFLRGITGKIGKALEQRGKKTYTEDTMITFIDWLFQNGKERVATLCLSENRLACRLCEKIGFRQEGKLRRAVWLNGMPHDIVLFGLLKTEWVR